MLCSARILRACNAARALSSLLPFAVLAAMLSTSSGVAHAGEGSWSDRTWPDASMAYSFNQWSIVPVTGARLEGGARLDDRQELRFTTISTGPGGYYNVADLWPAGVRLDSAAGLDQPRATYRYTWFSMRDLDLKVGLTSNLSQLGPTMRNSLSSPARFGALPQMHLSGVGRLTDSWHVSVDADGLWTARGRSLDLGLHVDYSLNRSVQLFGGYRLTDFSGDAEDFYGSGTSNAANVGLRFRF